MGDRADALTGAKLLAEPPSCLAYAFSLAIEPRHWDAAHACSLSRTLIKKIRGRQDFEARGADDERIDTEGAIAEILMALLLEKAGALIAPLVAHKPDSGGVDITLDNKRLDVKSIGKGLELCNINSRQHVDKAIDTYVLVQLTRADVADVFVVSHAGVTSWKQNTFIREAPLDPRRYYFSTRMPTNLEALPKETEV